MFHQILEMFHQILNVVSSLKSQPFSWTPVIIICSLQVFFFIIFLVEKRKMSVRFKNISTSKEFGSIISVESRNIGGQNSDTQEGQTFSGEERDLQVFVRPHLYRLLRAGESTNWEEINSQLLSQALRGEEVARAWMNNIIVLGLVGTAVSIALPIFFKGVPVGDAILTFVPPAFVPAALGLSLGILCSLLLSYRINYVGKEAEKLIEKFREYFPYPVSTADILRESFSGELRAVLQEFPEKLSQSFMGVQEDLEKIGKNLTEPLSNITDLIRNSVKEAGNTFEGVVQEASRQFEGFSKILTVPIEDLSKQLPLLQMSIASFGDHSKILQQTTMDFSLDLRKLVEHTDRNQRIINNLVEKLSTASTEFDKTIEKSNELLAEFKVLYRNIHDEYSKYVTDIFSKLVNSVENINTQLDSTVIQIQKEIGDLCVGISTILNNNSDQHYQKVEDKFTALMGELYQRVDERIRETFLGEIGLLKALKESFKQFTNEYIGHQEILKSYNDALRETTDQLKKGGGLLESVVTKTEKTSDELKIWWDTFKGHKDALNRFSDILKHLELTVQKMSDITLESHEDREKRLKTILERIENLRDLFETGVKVA